MLTIRQALKEAALLLRKKMRSKKAADLMIVKKAYGRNRFVKEGGTKSVNTRKRSKRPEEPIENPVSSITET